MALIPRWKYMTDGSKSIIRNAVVSALVIFIGLTVFRAFFNWIVLAMIIWAGWKFLNRK
ncbi:hypothetical protein [Synechococcus sp. M16CYN]|uniref:hypothetical protein n=1 Tax=Synechococcus sp. M16CYN TaxID=3103139 RepID=UPI003342CF7C